MTETPAAQPDVPALQSGIADIRRVPMAQLADGCRADIDATLRRIIPGSASAGVPVASAFNSSI